MPLTKPRQLAVVEVFASQCLSTAIHDHRQVNARTLEVQIQICQRQSDNPVSVRTMNYACLNSTTLNYIRRVLSLNAPLWSFFVARPARPCFGHNIFAHCDFWATNFAGLRPISRLLHRAARAPAKELPNSGFIKQCPTSLSGRSNLRIRPSLDARGRAPNVRSNKPIHC